MLSGSIYVTCSEQAKEGKCRVAGLLSRVVRIFYHEIAVIFAQLCDYLKTH
jgi:hypothetical protein